MNSLSQILQTLLHVGLPLLFAMVLHEYAHGWVAHYYGDNTAKQAGRLTFNPLAHIDPIGTILVPLMFIIFPSGFFFGWAKPVPVQPGQLRNPRQHMGLVAAAGPGMNLLLAIISALLLSLIFFMNPSLQDYSNTQPKSETQQDLPGMVVLPIAVMLLYSVKINIVLMVFNLLPIPPLDGGRVLVSVLPYQAAKIVSELEPYGMLILLGLIFLDPQLHLIGTVLGNLVPFITNEIFAFTQVL